MIQIVVVVDHVRTGHERELGLLERVAEVGVAGVGQLEGAELGFVAYSAVMQTPN